MQKCIISRRAIGEDEWPPIFPIYHLIFTRANEVVHELTTNAPLATICLCAIELFQYSTDIRYDLPKLTIGCEHTEAVLEICSPGPVDDTTVKISYESGKRVHYHGPHNEVIVLACSDFIRANGQTVEQNETK